MTILESLGVAKPSEPDQAMMFINRLDPTRFGPVMVFLANNAALNIAYPQTLQAAYMVVTNWVQPAAAGPVVVADADGAAEPAVGDMEGGSPFVFLCDLTNQRSASLADHRALVIPQSAGDNGSKPNEGPEQRLTSYSP
jgi:hypothetical protein